MRCELRKVVDTVDAHMHGSVKTMLFSPVYLLSFPYAILLLTLNFSLQMS